MLRDGFCHRFLYNLNDLCLYLYLCIFVFISSNDTLTEQAPQNALLLLLKVTITNVPTANLKWAVLVTVLTH